MTDKEKKIQSLKAEVQQCKNYLRCTSQNTFLGRLAYTLRIKELEREIKKLTNN